MNRMIVYPGANPLETDILNAVKDSYLGLSKLVESLIGTSPAAYGLSAGATTPASLNVLIQPGCIYQPQTLDTSAFSTLGTDANVVMKQGILLAAATLSCPAPSTVGYSINYLVQAQVQEVDGGSTVLPYYNSANPTASFNGPSNSGTSQNTRRLDNCNVGVKAGVAASSGSQTTPTVDAGYMPLYVVTVAYGQTTITAGNIAQHGSAAFLPNILSLLPAASYTAADVLAKMKTQGYQRQIQGRVTGSTGAVLTGGYGFTVTRAGTGVYTLAYSASFTNPPSLAANIRGGTGGSLIIVSSETTSGCQIDVFSGVGTHADLDFAVVGTGI